MGAGRDRADHRARHLESAARDGERARADESVAIEYAALDVLRRTVKNELDGGPLPERVGDFAAIGGGEPQERAAVPGWDRFTITVPAEGVRRVRERRPGNARQALETRAGHSVDRQRTDPCPQGAARR